MKKERTAAAISLKIKANFSGCKMGSLGKVTIYLAYEFITKLTACYWHCVWNWLAELSHLLTGGQRDNKNMMQSERNMVGTWQFFNKL